MLSNIRCLTQIMMQKVNALLLSDRLLTRLINVCEMAKMTSKNCLSISHHNYLLWVHHRFHCMH